MDENQIPKTEYLNEKYNLKLGKLIIWILYFSNKKKLYAI